MGVNYNTRIVTSGLVLCLDAANPKSLSQNVHPKPTDIYGWLNLPYGNNCTLSRDTIPSPVGNTPMRMDVTGNDPFVLSYNSSVWNLAPAAIGQTWTVSAWVKGSVATTAQLFIFEATDAGGYLQAPAGITAIGTNWQRISFTYTFINAGATKIQIRLDGPDTAGVTVWWDGVQVERSSTVTAFNALPNINGATWRDISNNGNNATFYNSPVFSSTNRGTVSFNGTTQYASIPNATCSSNFKSMPAGYTTIIGFKSNQTDTAWHNICGFGDAVNFVDLWYQQNTGYFGSDGQAHYLSTAPLINSGFGVYAHSFSGTTSKIYKNGTLLDTKAVTSGALTATTYGFNIAATADGLSYYHNMDVNFLMVYGKVLTDAEVSQNFNALRGRYGL